MRCNNCDREIGNNRFCGYCGQSQSRKPNKKIIVILCIVLAFVIVATSIAFIFVFLRKNNTEIKSFYSNEEYMVKGEPCAITFFAESESKINGLALYTNKKLAELNDNGLDGDEKPNDGIYSVTISYTENEKNEVDFYVKANDASSDKIKIYFFDKPNSNTKNEVEGYQNEIDGIESKYLVDGYVVFDDIPNVLNEVENYAKEMVGSGKAIYFEKTESSVIIKLSNGLTIAYSPQVEGTYSVNADTKMTVNAYQPFHEDVKNMTSDYLSLPSGVKNEAELINKAAHEVYSNFENYSMGNIMFDDQVGLSNVKSFGKNQIILWQGHGTFGGKKLHSLIYTGAEFNWDAFDNDLFYFLDCCQDRIVECGNSELFSYKFVDRYCDNLENTFIYLGPCESGMDDTLANAFLKKGAAAVIGNTKTILCLYGDLMEYTTTYYLTKINESTGNYYTLSEALNEAKHKYGNNDSKYNGQGAEPTIFGGEAAKNYRLADASTIVDSGSKYISGKYLLCSDGKLIGAKNDGIYVKETVLSSETKIASTENANSLISDGETVYYAEGVDTTNGNVESRFTPKKIYKTSVNDKNSELVFTSEGQVDLITYKNGCIYFLDITKQSELEFQYSLMKYDINSKSSDRLTDNWIGNIPSYGSQNAYCLGNQVFFVKNNSLCSYGIANNETKLLITSTKGEICSNSENKLFFEYIKDNNNYIAAVDKNNNIETSVAIAQNYDLQTITDDGKYGLYFTKGFDDYDLYTIDLKTGEEFISKNDAGACKGKNYFVTKDLESPEGIYFMYGVKRYDVDKKALLNTSSEKFEINIEKPMWIVDGYVVDWNLKTYKITDSDDYLSDSNSTNPSQSAEWKNLYVNYVNSMNDAYEDIYIAYIDDDDIPELYIRGKYHMAGAALCWIENGKVKTKPFYQSFGYKEKTGICYDFTMQMGVASLREFTLSNGALSETEIASCSENVKTYNWKGSEVGKNEFWNNYDSYIAEYHVIEASEFIKRNSFESALQSY